MEIDITPQSDSQLPILNGNEQREFDELCGVVDQGINAFFEVGRALAEIRDKRLYRGSHKTFEKFCRDKWDIGKSYTYSQIAAYEVVQNVRICGQNEEVHHGEPIKIYPTNEAQIRPLTSKKFDLDTQRMLWQKAVTKAMEENNGRVTGAIVSKIVKKHIEDELNTGIKKALEKDFSGNGEDRMSPEFDKAFTAFTDQMVAAHNDNYRATSRRAVLKALDELRDLVEPVQGEQHQN